MVVLRSATGGDDSKRLRSTDAASSAYDDSKRLRSRLVPGSSSRPEGVGKVAKPKKKREYTLKEVHDAARPYATAALSFYNKEACTNYELVVPGNMRSVLRKTCCLHHINFTAKKKDVADAPEEMFFAELTTRCGVLRAWLCTSLGPRNLISEPKNFCCYYCRFGDVHHPKAGGFTTGLEGGGPLFHKREPNTQ